MTRDEFVKKVDDKVRLIRAERQYTQDKMADIFGISKKLLSRLRKVEAAWVGSGYCSL
jgi:DNA-binding XRE family transcriptional regulator